MTFEKEEGLYLENARLRAALVAAQRQLLERNKQNTALIVENQNLKRQLASSRERSDRNEWAAEEHWRREQQLRSEQGIFG